MLIENWIAVLIIVFFFIGFMALAISGILNDQRLEDERKKNNELLKENIELLKENIELHKEVMRLNSKINLARLYVEMEGTKK